MSRLRATRQSRGMSARELAELAGVGQNTCYNLETEGTSPTRRTADRLAAALGCGVGELFDAVSESNRSVPTEGPGSCRREGCGSLAHVDGMCERHATVTHMWPLPDPVVTSVTPRPGWEKRANCAGHRDPDAFFPENGIPCGEVVQLCGECPVREDCFVAAATGPVRLDIGLYGGMTPNHREALTVALAEQGLVLSRMHDPDERVPAETGPSDDDLVELGSEDDLLLEIPESWRAAEHVAA